MSAWKTLIYLSWPNSSFNIFMKPFVTLPPRKNSWLFSFFASVYLEQTIPISMTRCCPSLLCLCSQTRSLQAEQTLSEYVSPLREILLPHRRWSANSCYMTSLKGLHGTMQKAEPSLNKILWNLSVSLENFIVFSGPSPPSHAPSPPTVVSLRSYLLSKAPAEGSPFTLLKTL